MASTEHIGCFPCGAARGLLANYLSCVDCLETVGLVLPCPGGAENVRVKGSSGESSSWNGGGRDVYACRGNGPVLSSILGLSCSSSNAFALPLPETFFLMITPARIASEMKLHV